MKIKFRVRWKRKEDGKIFTQIFDWNSFVNGTMKYNNGKIISKDQFTGLKDKNGKDIFAGDIVKSSEGEKRIIFSGGGFKAVRRCGLSSYLTNPEIYEIV